MKNIHAKPRFTFLLLLVTVIVSFSCSEEITKPIEPIEPPKIITPGRRDYTWDQTIIKSSLRGSRDLLFWSVSAITSNDIWATAVSDTITEQLWHYDGVSWKTAKIFHSNSRDFFSQIYAAASNNIWLCASDGRLFFFNGKSWEQKQQLLVEGKDYFRVQRIFGRSGNEIYLVGSCFKYDQNPVDEGYGVVFKYNGKEWKQLEIPPINDLISDVRVDKYGTLFLYCLGYITGIDKIYSFDGKNLTELLSGLLYFSNIQDKIVGVKDGICYILHNGSKEAWIDFKSDDFVYIIFGGRTEKDIFGHFGRDILHYNGENITHLFPLDYATFLYSIKIFENEVFFFFRDKDNRSSRVVHGKLN